MTGAWPPFCISTSPARPWRFHPSNTAAAHYSPACLSCRHICGQQTSLSHTPHPSLLPTDLPPSLSAPIRRRLWPQDVATVTCQPCPLNSECPGGAVLLPVLGFWHSAANSSMLLECPNQEACRGNGEDSDAEAQVCASTCLLAWGRACLGRCRHRQAGSTAGRQSCLRRSHRLQQWPDIIPWRPASPPPAVLLVPPSLRAHTRMLTHTLTHARTHPHTCTRTRSQTPAHPLPHLPL